MQHFDKIEALIETIYDAAIDPALWPGALASIAGYVGGVASALLSKDTAQGGACAHFHFGLDPEYSRRYEEVYWQFDPTATLSRFDVDEIVSVADLMAYDDFRAGRFFREWAKPQGWVDSANALLEKSATGCTYLTVIRDKTNGVVDDEMRRRLATLIPHVRRAVAIGKVAEFRQAEASTFMDVLDGLSAGLFLLNSAGRIMHANEAARDILATGEVLWSVGGRLVATDGQVNQTLRDMLAACEHGDATVGTKGIALPIVASDGEHYVAHALPLKSRRRNDGDAVTAAIFVRKAALIASSEVIGRAFKLTPTEMRVLLAIVEVGGVPEVAEAFGVADTTIKTHLGRLYEKTGLGRQADLVKLVAGFSTPLAN
ncbi:MAG: LuxR C-terminal-related transcriptional regulator [Devosia sp.]